MKKKMDRKSKTFGNRKDMNGRRSHARRDGIAVVSIFALIAAATMAVAVALALPPKPFVVYGWVNDTSGNPVNGPNVTVKNIDTGEEYAVKTDANCSHYRAVTSSWNISAGDTLRFNANDNKGNISAFNRTVTAENISDGGLFVLNITVQPPGICGDVTGDGRVRVGDGRRILKWIDDPVNYPIDNLWAADVTGDGRVRVGDGRRILKWIDDPDNYPLECRGSG